jgi:predicted nucleic acid-binding protein
MGAQRTCGAPRRTPVALPVIHLDTSFLIRSLAADSPEAARLTRWIRAGETLALSAVVWSEFLCGPLSAQAIDEAAELLGEPIAFDALDATLSAELFNAGGRRRGSLVDCMITATAIRREARLATSNRGDFQRFSALGLELA